MGFSFDFTDSVTGKKWLDREGIIVKKKTVCEKGIFMEGKIKNIVFDMGNVLTKYTLSDCIRICAKTEEEFNILKYQVCGSVEWVCMDRGTMTVNEAMTFICKRVPEHMHRIVECFILGFL